MVWLWIGLGVLAAAAIITPLVIHIHVVRNYIPFVVRIFQEKPLFILPFGQPVPDAENVTLTTPDGLSLLGCYLKTTKPRKGVILFGLEFGSNRWSCVPYCEFLREAGYDIFTFETRGQGNSPAQSGYEPLQWVTDFELVDFQTALAYLKTRPDKDPRGIGLFGLSKGGSAGLMAASRDDFIRCCVVDGAFASITTMVPYMKQWVLIYASAQWMARAIPYWYLRIAARIGIRRIERIRDVHYPSLEACMPKLAPRPLLMIHGGADSYIRPEMARTLFAMAGNPKELWLVEKAKHNQAITLAPEEYKARVLAFFDRNLAEAPPPHASNGVLV
ncbi:MAG TPA: alpha/beta fold hydrolase [Gemmataceae bacterium]|nr:alpha/beta fold hydrolase [Gemmataceae bacterium]